MLYPSRHIAVSIACSVDRVYAYASDPRNLPKWASGLSDSIAEEEDEWVAESPMGRIVITFAPSNLYGVLDHTVTLPSGEKILNPMRVVANGDGSEIIFTLFLRPGVSNDEFEADATTVLSDLRVLKTLLEAS